MSAGPRMHHFWDCVVVQGLRDALAEVLVGWAGGAAAGLLRRHLWLAEAPPTLHQGVWDVVCLACLSALETGRQALYAARSESGCVAQGALRRVTAAVVADFWARLRSFATLGVRPRGWHDVPVGHPFLSVSPQGRVLFQAPPDFDSPPASPRSGL